jgi:DNA-binding CsgD family transcriptional regulator
MTLSVDNYKKIAEFLYEISSTLSFSSVTLVKLIAKHFNINNVGFLNYVDQYPTRTIYDSLNIFRREINSSRNFKELAMEYQDLESEVEYLKSYYNTYFREDFMEPYNLPLEFRGKETLRASDLPPELYINTDYNKYLNSLGLNYFMSVYLYKGTSCIGRIGLLRTNDEGNFTDVEQEMFSIISKHLSQKLVLALEFNRTTHHYQLLNATTDNINSGVVILDSKFNQVYSNPAANQISKEILESKNYFLSDSIHIGGIEPLEFFCKQIIIDYQHDHTSYREFSFTDSKYSCNLTPIIFSIKDNESTTYYVISINKHTKFMDKSFFQYVKNFKLTPREVEVLELLHKGYNNIQIADSLVLSVHTVKKHISNLYNKLDVTDRVTLISKINKISEEN